MNTIRLLAIGNSLAENPLEFVPPIIRSLAGFKVEIGYATIGGCSLQKHANLADLTSRHPAHKTYLFDKGGAAGLWIDGDAVNLQEALVRGHWDFVTINQGSVHGPYRDTWNPWISQLVVLVRTLVPSSKILLNMTWAYRDDSVWLIERGWTSETMFERLRANYLHFARELDCGIIPTGEAIQDFRREPGNSFVFPDSLFEFEASSFPRLPQQDHSLSVGWFWNVNDTQDGVPRLVLDPNHLNDAGKYLGACTWAGILLGVDVTKCVWRPDTVDEEMASTLRQIARTACARYP
jgi:hypothetical protein